MKSRMYTSLCLPGSAMPCIFVAALAREARRSERPSPFFWWTAQQHPQPVWDMLLRWYCVCKGSSRGPASTYVPACFASRTERLYVVWYICTIVYSYSVRCRSTAVVVDKRKESLHVRVCTDGGQCELLFHYSHYCVFWRFYSSCVCLVWCKNITKYVWMDVCYKHAPVKNVRVDVCCQNLKYLWTHTYLMFFPHTHILCFLKQTWYIHTYLMFLQQTITRNSSNICWHCLHGPNDFYTSIACVKMCKTSNRYICVFSVRAFCVWKCSKVWVFFRKAGHAKFLWQRQRTRNTPCLVVSVSKLLLAL